MLQNLLLPLLLLQCRELARKNVTWRCHYLVKYCMVYMAQLSSPSHSSCSDILSSPTSTSIPRSCEFLALLLELQQFGVGRRLVWTVKPVQPNGSSRVFITFATDLGCVSWIRSRGLQHSSFVVSKHTLSFGKHFPLRFSPLHSYWLCQNMQRKMSNKGSTNALIQVGDNHRRKSISGLVVWQM